MGYACSIEEEQEAIQALNDNGYSVDSNSIGAYLNGDSAFFEDIAIEEDNSSQDFEFDLSGWD